MNNINNNSKDLAKYIRIQSLKIANKVKCSHIGSVLSCADILAVLYSKILEIDHKEKWKLRDRFIMSKGHASSGLYSCFAGIGLINESDLIQHCQNESKFSGHVNHMLLPYIELSTGSLGHGLPMGCGIAYALKLKEMKSRVYCLMSDGELDEGSNWEALLFASHNKLSNIKAIIDRNNLQSIKTTEETLSLEPLIDKFKAFNWNISTIDGHNHEQLVKELSKDSEKPHMIIANTIKGKGVSFMENSVLWHYKYPNKVELEKALSEVNK